MKQTFRLSAIAVLALGTMLGVIKTYAQQEGVAAKAGEKIDEFGRAIKNDIQTAENNIREGFTKTGEAIPEEFQKTRAAVHGMGLGVEKTRIAASHACLTDRIVVRVFSCQPRGLPADRGQRMSRDVIPAVAGGHCAPYFCGSRSPGAGNPPYHAREYPAHAG